MVLQNRQFTLFVELLQVSLGVKHEFVEAPSEEEWRELYRMGEKQTYAIVDEQLFH